MIEPVIFVGPPGTGKTTTLLDTVDQEMESGIPPDLIGFMTFTKRGVEEAVTRASERFHLPRGRFKYFNTLHSAAFRQLGLRTDQVFTGKKIKEFGEQYGYELHGSLSSDDGTYTNFFGDDVVLFLENYARITRQSLDSVLTQNAFAIPDYQRAQLIIKQFRQFKYKQNLMDFTDMIEEFIKMEDPPHLEVLIVDEAQDLSELQWMMVDQLAKFVKRMYIAGDDDQTIFTWAGASTRFISLPGKARVLHQSYRVPITVHKLANRVISKVDNRREKLWLPRQAEGSHSVIEGISQLDPSSLNSEQSVMMLGRTVKSLRRKFIPYCRANGILYRYFDANSIKPTFARAISAWNNLQEGMSIPATDALKIYELLPGETSKKKPGVAYGNKARLKRLADQRDAPDITLQELKKDYGLLVDGTWQQIFVEIEKRDVEYIEKVLSNGYSLHQTPQIHISTIHRVKGGQADKVILLSDTAKAAEKFGTGNRDEETRVFYTGITRTFEDLVVVHPDKKYHFERLFE
jgi:DNA helicase-2/ATP-dependent DNA helicase PcrA